MDDIKYSTHSHSVNKYDPNKDYGTPKSAAEKSVTLDIDGVTISVPEGTSIMHAAQLSGVRCQNYVQRIRLRLLAHADFV